MRSDVAENIRRSQLGVLVERHDWFASELGLRRIHRHAPSFTRLDAGTTFGSTSSGTTTVSRVRN